MTKSQIVQLQSTLNDLQAIDINKKVAAVYSSSTDLNNTVIQKMTVLEFVSLTKRTLNQLEHAVNTTDAIVLPFQFNTPEFGASDIVSMVKSLISHISSQQFAHAENSLLWLCHYQLQNGFFNRSKTKVHDVKALDFEKHSENLKLVAAQLSELKQTYDTLLTDIQETNTSLDNYYNTKVSELQQITNNLNASNTNTNQIQALYTNATQHESRIQSILEQVEKENKRVDALSAEIDAVLSGHKSEYQSLVTNLQKTGSDFSMAYDSFSTKLLEIDEKHQHFVDRNKYLDDLIGREVGASLFETFKQRKLELNAPLRWWRSAIITLGIFAVLGIFAIFTNFFGWFGEIQPQLHWENVVVNSIKSSPFIFLLYYSIAQYNKERNFQEEYAFKSASALTIKAYADILSDADNKDALVLKAVHGIYRSPLYSKAASSKEVNSAFDLVGEVVHKGSEIISKK